MPPSTSLLPDSTANAVGASGERFLSQGERFWPDHLGWMRSARGASWIRFAAGRADAHILRWPQPSRHDDTVQLQLSSEASALLPRTTSERLLGLGDLRRIPTPSVWEATATAVLRQVVHRNQARVVFDRLLATHGRAIVLPDAIGYSFPGPDVLLSAGEERLRELGIGFKAATLIRLAQWAAAAPTSTYEPGATAEELRAIPGIGPWTIAVALTDHLSDFSYYPVEDLAVRSCASRIWPRQWPTDPHAFASEWRALTHPYTSTITAFTLAAGALLPA